MATTCRSLQTHVCLLELALFQHFEEGKARRCLKKQQHCSGRLQRALGKAEELSRLGMSWRYSNTHASSHNAPCKACLALWGGAALFAKPCGWGHKALLQPSKRQSVCSFLL